MEFDGKTPIQIAKLVVDDNVTKTHFPGTLIVLNSVIDTDDLCRDICSVIQHFSNRGLMQAHGGLREVLSNQKDWSLRTFGPGKRTVGITKHIEKECAEVRENPDDLSEWIDIMILAMDGYWRAGGSPEMLLHAIIAKQSINRERTYPKTNEDEPSEHIRECHPYEIGSKP